MAKKKPKLKTKDEHLRLRISTELKSRVEDFADETESSVADVVRRALLEYMDKDEKQSTVAVPVSAFNQGSFVISQPATPPAEAYEQNQKDALERAAALNKRVVETEGKVKKKKPSSKSRPRSA